MGYMGFGMRKEVYTRKPKKAFEKLRKAYEYEVNHGKSEIIIKGENKLNEDAKKNIRNRIKKEERKRLIKVILATIISLSLFYLLINLLLKDYMRDRQRRLPSVDVAKIFNRKYFKENGEIYTIADYYKFGGIASSFRIKNGLKHQNSESYYFTGEQFRSALYYYDSLVIEYYFYKDGDTITNFPQIDHRKINHVSLIHPKTRDVVDFDVIDYKVIVDSYKVSRFSNGK
jgi:hypothetical protein